MGESRAVVEFVLATTDIVRKYGPEKLSRSALEDLRLHVLDGSTLLFEHDPRRPLRGHVAAAEVTPRADGEYELRVWLETTPEVAAEIQRLAAEAGGRLGWSHARVEWEGACGPLGFTHGAARASIAMDPLVWTLEHRKAAGLALAKGLGEPVRVGQYKRYSAIDEVAHIVIEVGPDLMLNLVASATWDALRTLWTLSAPGRKRRRHRLTLAATPGDVRLNVDTDDAEIMHAALDALPAITMAALHGSRHYEAERGWADEDHEESLS